MDDSIYYKLREILDTIPNGFPKTENGIEIRILKKIFTEEEAEITTKLKIKFETPDAIAERTGMDQDYLTEKLKEMQEKGQVFGVHIGDVSLYKLIAFVFGIYEFQLNRMDREFAELANEYMGTVFGKHFHSHSPSLMKVVPIEKEIPSQTAIEPYESITKLIENAKSWTVADCICKKEQGLLGKECDKPLEVCMGFAPIENYFDDFFWGRPISKEEAFKILDIAEEAGLVHLTSNVKNGHQYICNCCGCCCGMLRGINQFGINDSVARSNYTAVVVQDLCTACGICEERCQVNAIEIDNFAEVDEQCIGCGLCVTTCPSEAITLQKKDDTLIEDVPVDEKDWLRKRAKSRGTDNYKNLL